MCGWSTQDFPFLTNILSLIYSVRTQRETPQFDHARTMIQAWNSPTVEQMTRTSEYKKVETKDARLATYCLFPFFLKYRLC